MKKKYEEVIKMKSFRNKEKAKSFQKNIGKKAVGKIYKNPSWGTTKKPAFIVSYKGKVKSSDYKFYPGLGWFKKDKKT